MTKETIELIFNLGADACYKTIDQNTGNCNQEIFDKLKQDAVKLFYKPVVVGRSEQLAHCTGNSHMAKRFLGGLSHCDVCGCFLR